MPYPSRYILHTLWPLGLLAGALACRSVPRLAPRPVSVPVTAFIDVAVVPVDSERVLPRQTVLVQGSRITALGPVGDVRVPVGAIRVDGRGKFLIPGLADMHTHLATSAELGGPENALLLFLANGVTTIRNMDFGYGATVDTSRYHNDLLLRARAARGEILSPRIYTSGKWQSDTSQSIDQQIAAYKAAGYDFVKVHHIERDSTTLDSLAVAAHRVGIPILGHVPGFISVEEAIKLGYYSIEHLMGYSTDDSTKLRAQAVATQRAGVWNCPTLDWFVVSHQSNDSNFRIIKALQTAGAGLLSGTDANGHMQFFPNDHLVPGFSLHHELDLLVQAGLTPYQALATSTRNVAAYFGTLDETGTVAVGKRADLVLLRGNPLMNIWNTERPVGVILGGRWLSRAELDKRVAELHGDF